MAWLAPSLRDRPALRAAPLRRAEGTLRHRTDGLPDRPPPGTSSIV